MQTLFMLSYSYKSFLAFNFRLKFCAGGKRAKKIEGFLQEFDSEIPSWMVLLTTHTLLWASVSFFKNSLYKSFVKQNLVFAIV